MVHFKGGSVDFSPERELVAGDDAPFPPKVATAGSMGALLFPPALSMLFSSFYFTVKRAYRVSFWADTIDRYLKPYSTMQCRELHTEWEQITE